MSDPPQDTSDSTAPAPTVPRTLTARQEHRLADALETRFLDLTRAFKKRTTPTTTVPTLAAYLSAARPLLSLILLTPPSSSAQRTAHLLRYTSDTLSAVLGYAPTADALPPLLEWAGVLDRGWLAVLRGARWDSAAGEGVLEDVGVAGVSGTERIRLRSLLVGGTARIEEWLARLPASASSQAEQTDVEAALQALGLRERFEGLFERTLGELGVGEPQVEMTALLRPDEMLRFGDEDASGVVLGVFEDEEDEEDLEEVGMGD
ncbi:hypothetical protein K488DRAFT_60635 [Vararia minispora EC-137]|uniref:Uncharacterized protein n=1 Tax=Vararia minispora EC-137 TaxID=1314806 RepID=A0ACB8Q7F1_9AGAM|nr:hypothetical protein K488DRAFT_60635 [Vararia minispora EC-137]